MDYEREVNPSAINAAVKNGSGGYRQEQSAVDELSHHRTAYTEVLFPRIIVNQFAAHTFGYKSPETEKSIVRVRDWLESFTHGETVRGFWIGAVNISDFNGHYRTALVIYIYVNGSISI